MPSCFVFLRKKLARSKEKTYICSAYTIITLIINIKNNLIMKKLFTLIAVAFVAIAAQAGGPVTINVKADVAPYLYVWDQDNNQLNGGWPGTQMTETTEINGVTVWTQTFSIGGDDVMNIIFNDGNGAQTANIEGLACETVNNYTYDGATGYEEVESFGEGTEPVEEGYKPVLASEDEVAIWFETTRNAEVDHYTIWAWGGEGEAAVLNIESNDWNLRPSLVLDGEKGEDVVVFKFTFGSAPTNFLISATDAEGNQIGEDADRPFNGEAYTVNGYYKAGEGLIGIVTMEGLNPVEETGINTVAAKVANDGAIYTVSGVRVSGKLAKGLYIQNGKKFVVK